MSGYIFIENNRINLGQCAYTESMLVCILSIEHKQ